jgi:rhamnogalacturonyl hydrolase YesR
MRLTALEWFISQIENHSGVTKSGFENVIKQAKEKEYRQITNAYQSGIFDGFNKTSIDYYKETFLEEEDEIKF